MCERGVEVGGVVALTEHENLSKLVNPLANWAGAREQEKVVGTLPHLVEGHAELIEIDRTVAARRWVVTMGVELVAAAAWSKLVSSDTAQVGGVHEQLVLGDANREDVGHVVVWNRVAIPFPVDEAVDAAHAVDDPSRIVGVSGQGDELVALFGEAIQGGAAMPDPVIDDSVEPVGELGFHVIQIVKRTTVEE